MNTEQELRPCPFCGTSNKLKVTPYRADDDGGEPFDCGFTVICSALGLSHAPNRGCGASGAWGETEAEAIAAWNRRAPAVAAGGVTAEGIIAALAATEFHRSQIQGFCAEASGTHYIRDCTKPHDEQRIWSARSNTEGDYDLLHGRMMERIELERWRIVLAALALPTPPSRGEGV